MSTLRFGKYEGLGNDFILIDADAEHAVSPEQARALCDRHFGIGADGVILVLPSTTGAKARMLVLNADGSRPEMCGNGLRCIALHVARGSGPIDIDTDAGTKTCDVVLGGDSALVSVDMGRGVELGEHVSEFDGRSHVFQRVSMGNPHAVLFDAGYDDAEVDRFAPVVSGSIEGGANVEFVTGGDHSLGLVVWERGVGRTLACGTGAAAVAVAAASSGRVPFGQAVTIRLPGGPLTLEVEKETLQVHLRGPARRVFSGEVEIP